MTQYVVVAIPTMTSQPLIVERYTNQVKAEEAYNRYRRDPDIFKASIERG